MARRLLAAEQKVKDAEANLEDLTRKRDQLRHRYRDRIPVSDKADEQAKGIRVTKVGGIRIRVAQSISAARLSLKRYREAGHEITPEMKAAISPGRPYERWTVKAAANE
jgi:hypothetical protein